MHPQTPVPRTVKLLAIPLIVVAALIAVPMILQRGEDVVVVYCAHDATYAEEILHRFEEETGIRVDVKFDTEATKSLGLTELLIQQRNAPVCDVFWNNELFGTMELADRGLLTQYHGPGHDRIPQRFRDPEKRWCGFGGRFRVAIVNTGVLPANHPDIERVLENSPERFAIAKPLYGTTFTHYTVLWRDLGEEGLKQWHHDLRKRGVNEVLGNATVKNLVADGVCDAGWTDTDDYFLAEDAGSPVDMCPVRTPTGDTICIPNTVSIIEGAPHPQAARQFVDFLLSEDVEVALANGHSRQVPLGRVNEQRLPEQVRRMVPWVAEGVVLCELNDVRKACLEWLRSEYAGGGE